MTFGGKDMLRAVSEKEDMPESAVLSRILRWFGRQDEVIRREILGQMPRSVRRDVARMILRRMERGK